MTKSNFLIIKNEIVNIFKHCVILCLILVFSCQKKSEAQSNLYSKSFVLNSNDKSNIDSLKKLNYSDILKTEIDSITLEKSYFLSESFEFSNDSIDFNLIFSIENSLQLNYTALTESEIGCVEKSPSLIFVDEFNDTSNLKLIGDEDCKFIYYMGFENLLDAKTTMFLIKLQSKQFQKIRFVKNKVSYIDLILNEQDKEKFRIYADYALNLTDELLN